MVLKKTQMYISMFLFYIMSFKLRFGVMTGGFRDSE